MESIYESVSSRSEGVPLGKRSLWDRDPSGAICIEFNEKNLSYERQKILPVKYKHHKVGEFRIDLVVENKVVVELKSVERFDPVFESQLLSYMRLGEYKLGAYKSNSCPDASGEYFEFLTVKSMFQL